MMSSVMVSYTAARSDSLGVKANVGFLQRPERIVLLIIGALSTWDWESDFFLFNRMPQVFMGARDRLDVDFCSPNVSTPGRSSENSKADLELSEEWNGLRNFGIRLPGAAYCSG